MTPTTALLSGPQRALDVPIVLAPKPGPHGFGGQITVGSILPGFDAAKAHLYVVIRTFCPDSSGFVVSVPGHPEAVVHYLELATSTLAIKQGAAASVQPDYSYVTIEGLTPGEPATVLATRQGCNTTTKVLGGDGRVPLVAGRVTGVQVFQSAN